MNLRFENKDKISKEIYFDMEKQFPKEELKSFKELETLLKGKYYKTAVFYDGEMPAGYIFYLENDFLWIDYIAVFERYHSKGYGSKILNTFFEKYSNLKGCFFEVEPENEKNPQTVKRMNFYKKLGCKNLDFEYYFPNEIKELRLELLYKPFNEKIPDKNEILEQIDFVFKNIHSCVKSKEKTFQLIKNKNLC